MAIRIREVKSSRLSDDDKEVIVYSTGKYTGDLALRFARECLDQLLQMLSQAKQALEPSVKSPPVKAQQNRLSFRRTRIWWMRRAPTRMS